MRKFKFGDKVTYGGKFPAIFINYPFKDYGRAVSPGFDNLHGHISQFKSGWPKKRRAKRRSK